MKIAYLLLFQLSSSQTLVSRKNYLSVFPSFISGLSEVGFLNQVHEIFCKTRSSHFFQITIEVLVKCESVNLALYDDIDKKLHKLSKIIDPQIKTVSILKDNSMQLVYPLIFHLSICKHLKGATIMFPFSHHL